MKNLDSVLGWFDLATTALERRSFSEGVVTEGLRRLRGVMR